MRGKPAPVCCIGHPCYNDGSVGSVSLLATGALVAVAGALGGLMRTASPGFPKYSRSSMAALSASTPRACVGSGRRRAEQPHSDRHAGLSPLQASTRGVHM